MTKKSILQRLRFKKETASSSDRTRDANIVAHPGAGLGIDAYSHFVDYDYDKKR